MARDASRRRSRRDGFEREGFEPGDVQGVAQYLKERVYASFTGLAIVLVLANAADHHSASDALFTLVIGVVGITIAGLVSDIIAHLAAHGAFPDASSWRMMFRVAGGALATVGTPAILLALAWADVMSLHAALRASSIVYLVTLGLVGWFAVRRAKMAAWKQLVALAMLVVLGAIVIGLQVLAHG